MANDGKRPLPPKIAAMKARKRRKLENGVRTSEVIRPKPRNNRKSYTKADSLPWKKVSISDHLEDYEGFYGLEEVEQVEVIRDPDTGYISFKSNAVDDSRLRGSDSPLAENDGSEDDAWSGFDNDSSEDGGEHEGDKATTHARHQERKSQPLAPVVKPSTNGRTFQRLADHEDTEEVDVRTWKPLNLSPDTLASISTLRFSTPTPIQQSAIPEVLKGHDVIGKASTGSGKTLAFGIPILEYFLETRNLRTRATEKKAPLALILSPTRELAHQLDKHLSSLCSSGVSDGPVIATLTGGLSVQKQQRLLKIADIVIGTPGRLWEVISESQGTIESLRHVKFLVVDEADRLLSQGHFKEVEQILNALDRKADDDDEDGTPEQHQVVDRQTLVFSATFDRELQRKLASKAVKSSTHSENSASSEEQSLEYLLTKLNFRHPPPKFIDADPKTHLAPNLKESLVQCPAGSDKDLYLYTLLLLLSSTRNNPRTLIFTNSISAVKRLVPLLQNLGLPALALHSNMPQKARLRSVERFTSDDASCSILVATDVAARGLDIPHVLIVLHYHLPRAADMYVHRSGRTARAGQQGSSILICAPEEVAGVRRLVAKVHASQDADGAQEKFIHTLDLDGRIVSRLKPRVTLAKKLADVTVAKEKSNKEDEFLRNAAEELGVDYDSETFEKEASKGRKGRGAGRKQKEREAKTLSKSEIGALKAELKGLLAQRINVGVSERYIASGRVDMDEVLRQQDEMGRSDKNDGVMRGREFLGSVQGAGLKEA